jgi:hypothetical protein
MATFSFWRRIVFESKWFTLQLSLMGGYGLYVTFTRDTFPPPHCVPKFFENKVFSIFVYGFAATPIVNSCMLFMITSCLVWVFSMLCAACSSKGWHGQVDPLVFCIIWLMEYIVLVAVLVATIEVQVRTHTLGIKGGWPFGSTLALVLITVPARVVFVRAWRLAPHPEEGTKDAQSRTELGHIREHCCTILKKRLMTCLRGQIDR